MTMGGRKNVVFGFFYLVLTAALGPYMVTQYLGPLQQAAQGYASAVAELSQAAQGSDPTELARVQTHAILALNTQFEAAAPIESIKGGPHAHGNLEALLNIAVGLVLGFLVVGSLFKEIISWLFIGGAVLHSGMLFLGAVFGQGWAWAVLNTGVGPLMLLAGLVLAGAASVKGFRPQPAAR
jgi:hypothetical protein